MTTPLRFCPLIRVSTESQERQGESLRTQRQQIIQYVKSLDGTIPEYCWKYSGQEHATPGQERAKLDQLLADAEKGLFDAVIVVDASRWSRDNSRNKAGLEVLRRNGIKFFIATMEYDLHTPEHRLFIGMATEINEFQAKQQALKSLQNRIERAKRGIPSCGKLPYGRTFDRKTETWRLDEEMAKNIRWAAGRYLKGESLGKLAKVLGVNAPNLWKTLTKRAGDTWEQRFRSEELNIDETVTITIPRLLPEETIQAIRAQAAANKTYNHGHVKNRYLLSRMVFCAECGYAMFGQTNHGDRRYYRHSRDRDKPCDPSLWVPADDLENAVLVHLFAMFGNVAAMEEAITKAIPDHSRLAVLREEMSNLESKTTSVRNEINNLVRAIAKGLITDNEAASSMNELRDRERLLTQEIDKITPQLENIPSEKAIRRKAQLIQSVLRKVYSRGSELMEMTYEEKRELVQRAFAGKNSEGQRLGVYVQKTENPDRPWVFSIKGVLQDFGQGHLPMNAFETEEILENAGGGNFALYSPGTIPPECRFPLIPASPGQ